MFNTFRSAMKEMYTETNSRTSTIPGGRTKYLQPLDATVINSFKRHCEVFRKKRVRIS